jgi:hypothetical protein
MGTQQTQPQTEAIVPQEAQNSGILAQVQAETQAFELVQRQAKMLASSTMVPKDFANNVPNCAIALNISKRTGIDVLMVTQNIDIIHGRPGWRATALIGMIRSCGSFTPLRFVFDDDDSPTSCYAVSRDVSTGEELRGEKITLEMAKKEGWSTKSGSKWLTMPGQMLRYRAASFWSRAYASDISLGMYTTDEVRDFAEPPRNVTPKVNPFVAEPEPEPEPVEVVEAQVVEFTPKKDSAKPHADKIAEAFQNMAKEVEP